MNRQFCLASENFAWRVGAERLNTLKLWCFWSAECGFESWLWHLHPWVRYFYTINASFFGWDIKPYVLCTGIGSERRRTQNTYHGIVGVNPGISGSHTCSKHPCLQVSQGLRATLIKFTYMTYEASLVSLLEIHISMKEAKAIFKTMT